MTFTRLDVPGHMIKSPSLDGSEEGVRMADTVTFEEPRLAKTVFGSSRFAWVWLVARLWVGWEWFVAGWAKVFGGELTWRVWDWGNGTYSLTGSANIGWIRSGAVTAADGTSQTMAVGDAVKGYATGAIQASQGAHPDVAFSWYVRFLEWVRDTGHTFIGPVVAVGELVIGIALILGAFVGVAAALGALLNFSYMFAGTAGVNPAMVLLSVLLILAWRNAGWIGLDRMLLPRLGVPWKTTKSERQREPALV
jgi:thiosulfate dehydrogenase [quinone] large subunit